MVLTSVQRTGRAAFTLIELLVVIGLMAVLATVSVAGYSAASRGMADRGVIQSTVSALRVAQQTCQIDHVPTRVLFFNQLLTEDSKVKDEYTECHGTIIGIKQAGRITIHSQKLLIDEFADWHQSYSRLNGGDSSSVSMRFYRMNVKQKASSISQCSSLVKPSVDVLELKDYMIEAGTTIKQWCTNHRRTESDNEDEKNGNNAVWGMKPENGGLSASDWNVGDAYGIEIVWIDLPKGYIFGKSLPKAKDLKVVADTYFVPDKLDRKLRPVLQGDEVQISWVRTASDFQVVGKIDKSWLEDD